jgi:hypothetical protein
LEEVIVVFCPRFLCLVGRKVISGLGEPASFVNMSKLFDDIIMESNSPLANEAAFASLNTQRISFLQSTNIAASPTYLALQAEPHRREEMREA